MAKSWLSIPQTASFSIGCSKCSPFLPWVSIYANYPLNAHFSQQQDPNGRDRCGLYHTVLSILRRGGLGRGLVSSNCVAHTNLVLIWRVCTPCHSAYPANSTSEVFRRGEVYYTDSTSAYKSSLDWHTESCLRLLPVHPDTTESGSIPWPNMISLYK